MLKGSKQTCLMNLLLPDKSIINRFIRSSSLFVLLFCFTFLNAIFASNPINLTSVNHWHFSDLPFQNILLIDDYSTKKQKLELNHNEKASLKYLLLIGDVNSEILSLRRSGIRFNSKELATFYNDLDHLRSCNMIRSGTALPNEKIQREFVTSIFSFKLINGLKLK